MNQGILTAIASIGVAQVLKVPLKKYRTKQWDLTAMLQPGGMPSSHSAGVTSLATYIALNKGMKSVDFALASIFGAIVLYDAMGVRRHAGEIAIEVNELDRKVEELAGEQPGVYHRRREEALKEVIGHQPIEVFWGSLLGIVLGSVGFGLRKK
ncbi:divergent PAP2 family protein [Desulforamulus aquiferis]|uniref:Divergent PAP2 family protein n=1 Tax=Desulforamulus aquiferis TaxID=1397668 RepID=A0AAW7ZCD1_9FIRM|nr:divergent PAP2 family protein [Desulforamulus aquiferis]MDO7787098.1 divergent PAP2 family protein [Desulforamulus aquiferis]RYD02692.1 hypothetical protein N752_23215 [Desulforamulus aquiferis]